MVISNLIRTPRYVSHLISNRFLPVKIAQILGGSSNERLNSQ